MATITSPRAASPASATPRIKSPSLAETPTSSVRGSFELPSRNPSVSSTSTPNPNVPQRRGNRAALRDYYNLKSKPQQQGQPGRLSRTASVTSITSEVSTAASVNTLTESQNDNGNATSNLTAQLDNQDFDAEAYISGLLSTSGLKDVLRVEATLVSEIRNLDGERKALVYDNYSKLIMAVGTIGEMQRSMNAAGSGLSEVGELEGRMDRLRGMATNLGRPGKEDAQSREERRRRREEGGRQKGRTDLVKRVLAAPANLKVMLGEGKEEEAEREWEFVRKHLNMWSGVKGVEEVRTQCEAIMSTSSDEDEGQESEHDS